MGISRLQRAYAGPAAGGGKQGALWETDEPFGAETGLSLFALVDYGE